MACPARDNQHGMTHKARHNDIAERIRLLILDGAFAAGERLSEKALCQRFDVSRTPIREALKALASEGLVTITPNRGASVSQISQTDLAETFQVMGALEALAGELAAKRMSNDDIDHVEALHTAMVHHYKARRLGPYFALNQNIHEAILVGAGNIVLSEQYRQLAARMRLVRYRAVMSQHRWTQAVREHEIILERLRNRDANGLAEILRHHLDGKWQSVMENLTIEPGSGVA